MLQGFRRARILIPFFSQRVGDYAALAQLDLIAFRNEMIAAIIGAAVCLASILMLLCFVCIALLITEWETPNRIITAWVIVAAWALMVTAGAFLARFLMKGSSPFKNIASEIALDLSIIKNTPDEHAHE